jgi:hypothetical protein
MLFNFPRTGLLKSAKAGSPGSSARKTKGLPPEV